MDRRKTEGHVSAILNTCWMVRHYARGGTRLSTQGLRRQQAIQLLGLTLLEALTSCDDFEPIIAALLDGLRPKDDQPF